VASRAPLATAVGSAVGAGIVLAAAGALGAGAVGFATSITVGMVLGGLAGGQLSEHRARTRGPREALRRRRSIRLLRITRTMQRRRLRQPRSARPPIRLDHLVHAPEELRTKP
jgi:Na+/glutamate symporter